tara:strand:- start:1806 stop:2285 length:480 start_codon:yes stop_codon:yes gene_type:complete
MIELALQNDPNAHRIYADWLRDNGYAADGWDHGPANYRGYGPGIGRGIGSGRGIGRGIGSQLIGRNQMIEGKSYLIHEGDWHTFVGRLVRQVSPLIFEFESVSKVRDTNNGDCWHDLASGDATLRKACDYTHYTTPVFLPLAIGAFEWIGKTPQEEGLD